MRKETVVDREDELIRVLFYNKISNPDEVKKIIEELLKKERLRTGNLIFLIELLDEYIGLLDEYETEGKEWARKLKRKALLKLKKVYQNTKTEGVRKYIQRIIEEYDR
jgi:hypothetical protein